MKFDWEGSRKCGAQIGVAFTVTGALNVMLVEASNTGGSLMVTLLGIVLIVTSNLRK